ncbi:uncharacterized protein LOC117316527 [Pecten maximus]|uniref:uncharacterized protein LOC117316527 n=1 Tax=Pecten maximus TaxID=6579 RepID=UPI001457E9F1|nr:uncharacterized protein LOC117316527 [Pecten maximus]
MGDICQLLINTGGVSNKRIINIKKDASVEDLFEIVAKNYGIHTDHCRIIFAAKQLVMRNGNRKMLLSDYNLMDKSELFIVFRLKGGSGKVFPKDVEQTTERDMIAWDDDPNNPRAKMPCGHAITADSLTAYCEMELKSGKITFRCPYGDGKEVCGRIWEYPQIRRLGVLTDAEKKEFETRLANNYLNKAVGIQQCPKCFSFCTPIDSKTIRCVCTICKKNGKSTEFCWYCLRIWNSRGTKPTAVMCYVRKRTHG